MTQETPLNPAAPRARSSNPAWAHLQELIEAYYLETLKADPKERSEAKRDALFAAMHREVPHLADLIAHKRAPQGLGGAAGPTAIGDEVVARFWAKRSPTKLAKQYDPAKASFYTWIARVLNNEYLNWVAAHKRREGEVDFVDESGPETREDGFAAWGRQPGPVTRLSGEREMERTRAAIAALPAEMRQVAVLRGEGHTVEAIAAQLDVSRETVKRRQTEAFARLRRVLGDLKPAP